MNSDQQDNHPSPKLPAKHRSETGANLELRWNSHAVQVLIDDAHRRGETPVVLCLGRQQAAALKTHLSSLFEDGVVTSLKNQVYAGLKIVELKVDSLLRVETLHTIYDGSRHAEQAKIRDAMKQDRFDHGAGPPTR